jgi:hypothetical protein
MILTRYEMRNDSGKALVRRKILQLANAEDFFGALGCAKLFQSQVLWVREGVDG